ncbi:MAG: hypothetical protein GY870_19590 [archaeon]|nr:hypothetical protein [archaeon]
MVTNRNPIFTPRNIKIMASIIIFISIVGILFVYNWSLIPKNDCESDCIVIYGNVSEEWSISVSSLRGIFYNREENMEFNMLNSYSTEWTILVSGVQLWDIFEKLDIINDNAEFIKFVASDGYFSPKLPIAIIRDNPESVILATHEDGELIKNKTQGGDGPIIPIVELDVVQNNETVIQIFEEINEDFVHNSKYKVKYLSRIEII